MLTMHSITFMTINYTEIDYLNVRSLGFNWRYGHLPECSVSTMVGRDNVND